MLASSAGELAAQENATNGDGIPIAIYGISWLATLLHVDQQQTIAIVAVVGTVLCLIIFACSCGRRKTKSPSAEANSIYKDDHHKEVRRVDRIRRTTIMY